MSDAMDISDDFNDLDAEIEAARQDEANLPDQPDEAEAPEEQQEEAPPAKDYAKIAEDKSRALKEERQRRRQLEERLAALESKAQTPTDDPLKAILEIDEDQDPIGAIKALKEAIKVEGKSREQQAFESAQQAQLRQIQTRMADFEAEFRADNPDYDDAVKFFADARKEALAEEGLGGEKLMQQLQADLIGVTLRAMSSGRDPAEVVYNLAKKQGFGAKAAEKVDTGAQKLQMIDRGQKASKTLGSAGGAKTSSGEITVEQLNRLDGAAFDKALAKFKEQQKRRA